MTSYADCIVEPNRGVDHWEGLERIGRHYGICLDVEAAADVLSDPEKSCVVLDLETRKLVIPGSLQEALPMLRDLVAIDYLRGDCREAASLLELRTQDPDATHARFFRLVARDCSGSSSLLSVLKERCPEDERASYDMQDLKYAGAHPGFEFFNKDIYNLVVNPWGDRLEADEFIR